LPHRSLSFPSVAFIALSPLCPLRCVAYIACVGWKPRFTAVENDAEKARPQQSGQPRPGFFASSGKFQLVNVRVNICCCVICGINFSAIIAFSYV